MNSTRKPETFDKPALVAMEQKSETRKRILSSINQRPACVKMRDRELRRIVRSKSAGINTFKKLVVMIPMIFLRCMTGKVAPVNTSEVNYRPTQPSI